MADIEVTIPEEILLDISLNTEEIITVILNDTGTVGNQGPQGVDGESVVGPQGTQGVQGSQGYQGATGSQGTQGDDGDTGPQGYQGTQGNQGHRGYQGYQGEQGEDGPQGNTGVQGHQGYQGTQGVIGNQGVQGVQGAQGFKGNQGNQGFQGTQGNTGSTGSQGPQGYQGQEGDAGPQGVQGTQGNQGYQGVRGFQGFQGTQGVQGNQGVQGSQGHQGNQGNQGTQGVQGNQGTQGNQGNQGTQGNQGVTGAQGNQGVQGAQGFQGNQGNQGTTGSQGSQGNQGTQGPQGYQGTQGVIGNQGTQGYQGYQGYQGNQGYQGLKGVFGGDSLGYTFSDTTTDSDPGIGKLRFNNSTIESVTQIYIDSKDENNTDQEDWIKELDASTSTVKGAIRICHQQTNGTFVIFHITGSVTDAGDYLKIPVTFITRSGTPINDDLIFVSFTRYGNNGSGGGSGVWGDITGTLSDQTDLQSALDLKVPTTREINGYPLSSDIDLVKADIGLGNVDNTSDVNKPVSTATQTALDLKVDENVSIIGATKTKITYDAKGLVTAGADATTADINDSADRRYLTDAQQTVVGDTSGTNTGDQDLSGKLDKSISPTPSDTSVSGWQVSLTAGESLVFGDICYIKSDGKMWKADANGSTTYPALLFATTSISAEASGEFLIIGFARNDTWTWTVGGAIYLSTTLGGMTQTQPSGTDEVIQVLGIATHADRLIFKPSIDYMTHI